MVYDPNQKTLNADRGEIRVGSKYQAEVPAQPISNDGTQGNDAKSSRKSLFLFYLDDQPSREDLIWNANSGLTEKQIEQYLIVARYFTFIHSN